MGATLFLGEMLTLEERVDMSGAANGGDRGAVGVSDCSVCINTNAWLLTAKTSIAIIQVSNSTQVALL
jgi:hypothetical protein